MAEAAIGYDFFATSSAWTIFTALVIFAGEGSQLYAKIGILSSLTLVVSLFSAHFYGKAIDRRGGATLLVASTIINSITHLFRSTVQGWAGLLANNAANEVATTGYSMAFTRGLFDTADRSGYRISYLFLVEMMVNVGAALAAASLGICCMIANGEGGLSIFFPLAAIVTLGIGFPHFRMYKK